NLIEHREVQINVESAVLRNDGDLFLRVLKADVGSIEPGFIFVTFKDVPHALSEYRPQEDVGIQNQPLARAHLCSPRRQPLNPRRISSSDSPSAARAFCRREAASCSAARSVSVRLRRAGM